MLTFQPRWHPLNELGSLAVTGFRPLAQVWRYVKTVLGVVFRHPLVGVTMIPVMPDGRLVLVKRRDNGLWSLPGGLVDWGDTIASTIHRELAEETGLTVVAVGRLVGVYSAFDRDPRIHAVNISVEVQVTGTIAPVDQLEIAEVGLFAPSSIGGMLLAHDHARQVQDYFRGQAVVD
ncbi:MULTISPECIES: NUDIX hydrolase [unclassified Limnothrix]|uniref:NUDIX hydrolase n=1 Tax=unclassified Limnothrix TaxID=2632864 RepID=UPI00272E3364|nr:NUDIX hydrolase [Limnothrix sp. FACHB-1083]